MVEHPLLTFTVAVHVSAGHAIAVFGQIFDRWLPCSKLTLAVVFPVAQAPTVRASNTNTSLPARANRTAGISPVITVPATMRSADWGPSSSSLAAQGWSTRSLSHKEVTAEVIPRQRHRETVDRDSR